MYVVKLHLSYHIAGYFCGVLIFIIFVVNPGVMKFPPTKLSTHTAALSTRTNVQTGRCFYSSFSLLVTVGSALDSQGPLSQVVPRVVMEEVNREVNKAEAQLKNRASMSRSGK